MRIVLFWDHYGPYHFARARALRAAAEFAGHSVVFVELADRSATYAWARKCPPPLPDLRTLFPGEFPEGVSSWRVFAAIRRFLREQAADVLMVPSYWPGYVVAATQAARSCGVRLVIMAESHYASGKNTGILVLPKRWLVSRYDSALVGGSKQRAFFRYLGMDEQRIFDGYDVVDNEYFSAKAEEARSNRGLWQKALRLPRRYILSLGRLVPKKNLGTLLRGYSIAVAKHGMKDVHLLFVGSGPESTALRKMAERFGLPVLDEAERHLNSEYELGRATHAVHFRRFAQIDHTPVYFALAECFALVSEREEWGLVVNEAMASGCPVIVSDAAGACSDLVDSGETGVRVSPTSADELAWHFYELSCNAGLRRKLAAAGLRRIHEWGPNRFGSNSVLAAEAAFSGRDGSGMQPGAKASATNRILLIQTSFPDYRIPFYAGLRRVIGPSFQLRTGMDYFTPDVRTCPESRDWIHIAKNVFLFRRTLLWQRGIIGDALSPRVVILELNPRILTNWIILVMRSLNDRPTLLWGHAWARKGPRSLRNVARLLMMRLATAVVTYTHTQRDQLSRLGIFRRLYAAPNSLMPRAECRPILLSADALNLILCVGRLNPSKRPHSLLAAFRLVAHQLPPQIELLFIGAGAEREPLEELIRSSNLGHRVHCVGHIGDINILRSYYARALCSVSPGYVGLSAIQSFSFGVPMVIADNARHAPEIEACRAGENCLFFDADKPEALGAALLRMYTDKTAWLGRRTAIAAWTAERYSTDAMIATFSRALEDTP